MKVTISMTNGDVQNIEKMDDESVMDLVDAFQWGEDPVLVFNLGVDGDVGYFARRHIVNVYVEPDPPCPIDSAPTP